jgi:hypothetical protein
VLLGIDPVLQRRTGTAHVEYTGRRWGKSYSNSHVIRLRVGRGNRSMGFQRLDNGEYPSLDPPAQGLRGPR